MRFIKRFTLISVCLLIAINITCLAQKIAKDISSNSEIFKNGFILGQQRDVIISEGQFHNYVTENNEFSNTYSITTFHAKNDLVEIYFTDYKIPPGAEIRIYNGKSNKDQLWGIFGSEDKIWNVSGRNITVEYIPSNNYRQLTALQYGFKGVIRSLRISDPSTASNNPASDCPGAIPLCQNSTVVALGGLYTDTGTTNDDGGSCYGGTGSGGSVWYSFTPETDGPLDFNISPTGSTDYDFVVWDITNGCGNGQRVELSCNYSLYTGNTGLSSVNCSEPVGGGGNCTSNNCTTDSKQSDCNRFNRRVNVLTTHQYAVCINFYSGSNDGFVLSFKNEASSVNITDITPPFITNAFVNACGGATALQIRFNEWVDCTTIQNADFTLAGYTFTVSNTNCVNGTTNVVDLTVAPPLALGNYSIHAQDILDMCGNNMNSNFNIVIGSVPIANAGPDKVICKSPGFLGIGWNYSPASQTLNASSGTSYVWSNGQLGATNIVSPTSTTTYIVTVANGSCIATDTCIVFVEQSPAPNIGPDFTMCAGFPMTLNASGGVSYQWQVQTGTNLFGQPTFTNIAGATNNSYSTTPVQYASSGATYYQVIVTSPGGCTGSDQIHITFGSGAFSAAASPPTICQGSSTTLSLPSSITSYDWVGGPSNIPYVVSPATTTTYTVNSTTAGCTGTATVTVYVNSLPVVTATASNPLPCPGDVVTLNGAPSPASSTITENFEGATHSLTIINGANNKWYQGTAALCNGTKSLYIGTAAGNNNYINLSGFTGIAAVNFAYMDISVAAFCDADLSFNWKCLGKATDNLMVWAIPVSTVPVAGTALTATGGNVLLGGPYWNNAAACNPESLSLLQFNGTTVRIVFQWQNIASNIIAGNTAANPAASVDDILYSESTAYSYSWTSVPTGFTSSAQSPTVTPALNTTYTLTATRCDGCVNSASTSVTMCAVTQVPVANFSSSDTTICTGSCIDFTDLSTNSPTSWVWTFQGASTVSSNTQHPTGICYNTPGTYNVTLISINGFGSDTVIKTIFINVLDVPTVTAAPNTQNICSGSSATLTATSTLPGTTYTWMPGNLSGNSISVTPASTTSYTLTGTIAGCSTTSTATVVVNQNPSVTATSLPTTICSGTSVTLNATSNLPGTTYTWMPGNLSGSSVAVSPALTTTYTLTGTAAGCTGSNTVTVTVNAIPVITPSALPPTICEGSSTSLSSSSNIAGTTYLWTPGNLTGGTISVSPISTTTYTVTGTASGCAASNTVTVTVNALPIVTPVAAPSTICSGASTTLSVNSSIAGTTYLWTPGNLTGNSVNVTPTATTSYTVTGTAAGCAGTNSITVNVNANPVITPTATPAAICSGNSTTLTVNSNIAGTTYLWMPGNMTGNSITVSPNITTTYIVTGTFANCSASNTVTVTVNAIPIITPTATPSTICNGSSALLTAGSNIAGTTFLWTPGNLAGSSINVTPSATTTYTVTGTAAGCAASNTATINVDPSPVVSVSATPSAICAGSSTALTANSNTAGTTWLWSPGNLTGNTISVSPGVTTTYTATGTAAGCTSSNTITVTVNAIPVITPLATPAAICEGSSTNLSASSNIAGTTFLWMPGNLTGSSITTAPLISSNYTVTGTANGCAASNTVSVTVSPIPAITISAFPAAICNGSSTTLSAGSSIVGTTFLWTPGNLTGSSISVTPSANTTYTATGTSLGCSASNTVTVNVDPAPVIAISALPSTICEGSSTTLSANSNTPGTTWLWMPGNITGNTITVSPSATSLYTTTGTAAGCSSSNSVTVTVNAIPVITLSALPATICNGTSTTLNANSSLSGTTYLWTPGNLTGSSISVSPTTSTTYSVTGTASGCTSSNTMTVNVDQTPVVSSAASPSAICEGSSTILTATSNAAGTTWVWMPGNLTGSSITVSPSISTTYTATGTALGCSASNTTTVTVNAIPIINSTASPDTICEGSSTILSSTSNISGTSWLWMPGNLTGNSVSVTPVSNTTYTVTGTAVGCSASFSLPIAVNTIPVISASAMPSSICNGSSTALIATSNIPGTNYLWMPGNLSGSSVSVSPTSTTSYTVTGTAWGCSSIATTTINVNAGPVVTLSALPPAICEGNTTILSAASNTPGTTWLWMPGNFAGNSISVSPNSTSTYTVTGTATGCTTNSSISVTVNPNPSITITAAPDTICDGQTTTLTASGAANYTWSPTNAAGTSISVSPSISSNYSVTGTDLNGCVDSSTIIITIIPVPDLTIISTPPQGCSPLQVSFNYNTISLLQDSSWIWNFGDVSSSLNSANEPSPSHIFENEGTYIIGFTGITAEGCAVTATDTVNAYQTPVANFSYSPETASTLYPLINFYDLSLDALSWSWTFNDPGDPDHNNSLLTNPTHFYSDSGFYQVQLIVDNNGCSDTIVKNIIISFEPLFYIPNAFSPNNDGSNDVFIPLLTGIESNGYSFIVFNRWGQEIFNTSSFLNGWDGKSDGEEVPIGVYAYAIKYKQFDGKSKSVTGIVTLVR